ncbi:hypothetical protein Ccel01_21000 [Cellulosimicrobium cellulans]|uniref:Uncharacterized protein n=1 Tax=Cellulosimicrobium cellulans TaxID=1710 RepID=A0AAV5P4F9_CELCE|nr:hypothetical protein Ccel01_21000 [Cellulosimicrobium cellulans]
MLSLSPRQAYVAENRGTSCRRPRPGVTGAGRGRRPSRPHKAWRLVTLSRAPSLSRRTRPRAGADAHPPTLPERDAALGRTVRGSPGEDGARQNTGLPPVTPRTVPDT